MNKYNFAGDVVLYTSIFEAFHFACSSRMCLDESNPRCSVTVTTQNQNKELKEQLQDDEAPSQEKERKYYRRDTGLHATTSEQFTLLLIFRTHILLPLP